MLLAALIFPGGLFALAFGLALKGADRRVAARLQGRVGPPLAQPFFDLVKLGFKRMMAPTVACEPVFFGAPLIGAASMLVAIPLIPIAGVYAPPPLTGDLLVLLYLLAVPGVALMVAGSASGSPYGAIGFSREMAMMIAYEGPIVLIVDRGRAARRSRPRAARRPSRSPRSCATSRRTGALLLDPVMWPAIVAFAFFYPANLGIVPFDIPEAETEVLEGPLLEYSGPALALFKIMSALKAVVVLGLGVALFLPLPLTGVAGARRLAGRDARAGAGRRDGGARRRRAHAHRPGLRLLPEVAAGAGAPERHRRRLFHGGRRARDRPRQAQRHRRALAVALSDQRRLLQRLRRRARHHRARSRATTSSASAASIAAARATPTSC